MELGLNQSQCDPCLWIKPETSIILVLYVEDLLIAAQSLHAVNKLLSGLKSKFKLQELGAYMSQRASWAC